MRAELVAELVDYTRYHFAAEEAFARKHGWEDLRAHERMHLELIVWLAEVQLRAARGDFPSIAVLQKLADWLTHHIREEDRRHTQFAIAAAQTSPTRTGSAA